MRFNISATALFLLALSAPAPAQSSTNHLAGNTVLIIRHAEKPATGTGLTAQGEARARAYIHYFEPFHEQNFTFKVDALYSGADSDNSLRPRLTLEPLSKATGIVLHSTVSTGHPEDLVAELKARDHGHTPLIAWRHGQIPALLRAFGASPEEVLPNGIWPDDVFDNVILLSFDPTGKLISEKLIHESLQLPTIP